MTEEQRVPCSTAARARGDRRVGTAPPARQWFLVEQAADWGPNAWQGLAVDADTKEQLRVLLDGAGVRLMLIRRHGGGHSDPPVWGFVDQDATTPVRWGTRTRDEDLLQAARALLDPDGSADPLPTDATDPGGTPVLLVCTHGRKDPCCATRGRPVAAALSAAWPQNTWECSHTGGDRFAANVIILPDGACYGGTDPETAVEIVTAHLESRVLPAHLRGATGRSKPVQAAVVAAHERLGPLAWPDVRVGAEDHTAHGWHVELEVAGQGRYEVSGHLERTEEHWLTCRAVEPAPMELPIVDGFTHA